MITIETKISGFLPHTILTDFAQISGTISRKYFVDRHIKNKSLNGLKSSYQEIYGISARHFNSIRAEVDGKVRAYEELLLINIKEKEEQILAIHKTIAKLHKDIKSTISLKTGIKTHKAKVQAWKSKDQKKKKPKLAKKLKDLTLTSLDLSLEKMRFKLHQKQRRLGVLEEKRLQLEKKKETKSLCFGSRALFRKQFHLKESGYATHYDWKLDWQLARNSQSFWIGSHDESFRNLNAQYNPATKTLSLRLPKCLENKYGTHYKIENLSFPYGQELLEETILKPIANKNGKEIYKPVSYRILERKTDEDTTLYCQAIFDQRVPEITSDIRLGAIGIDLNADHIAMMETDRFGNPVFAQSYPFIMHDKSSDQVEAVFADHIASIVEKAKISGKIIVCEKLDFSKQKKALRESSPKNFRVLLSSFAYKKFFTLLLSRCSREGVYLKDVNPAFTSLIGFYKFIGYGIYTSHECAALSIARRGLRLSERAKNKVTPSRIVNIEELLKEVPEVSAKNSDGHVWSYYSRNAIRIRKIMFQSSQKSRRRKLFYNPRHPSGYHAGLRCDGTLLRALSP